MNATNRKNSLRLLTASLLAGAIGMASAGVALAQDATQERDPATKQGDSEQPMGDTWITTKVKAEMLATEDVSGLDVGVETVNGVVHLSGDVDTQAEIDRAVAVAQRVEGVIRVDSTKLRARGTSGDSQ